MLSGRVDGAGVDADAEFRLPRLVAPLPRPRWRPLRERDADAGVPRWDASDGVAVSVSVTMFSCVVLLICNLDWPCSLVVQ